ncbi:MAG TPA: CpsD/CapB family tyrosine-protein kinase [Candidatus Dormibacteraeota bacterium]|nr:CpsD/CapB family tyrosine-protein kinase [Candidatus Dormibacteraeota bacterium]
MTENGELVLTEETLNTHFAEAYRALRANISFSSIDRPVKTILVTSASPREGKTTTAINLGIILAQAGPRVLIVDADFRRPSLHHMFGFSPNGKGVLPGLSNVIVGNSKLAEVLLPTGFDRVSFVPSGIVPPNPSELLGSQRMLAVMSELAEHADFVVMDTPPCLLYADAVVLSPLADGVLYVVRSGPQDKAAQRRVHKQLQQAKARILGVVFNDAEVEETAGSYHYYYADGNKQRRK